MKEERKLIRFDWAIKRLLRHKADHTVLEGFLTSLLGEKIRILKILESESNCEAADSKYNRVDILAETPDGVKILIEIQNESEDAYFHRMLFGTSRLVSEYIHRGDNYDKISKIYSINIVYFNLGEGSDYIYRGHTEFRGLHDHDLLQLSPRLREKFKVSEIGDIFPEYFILRANDFDHWSNTPLDQWMYFLSNSEIPAEASAPGLAAAREQLRIDRLSNDDRRAYYDHLDNMTSMRSIVDDARDAGLWEGRKEGREEGRLEEKLHIAKKLLESGMDVDEAARIVSLNPSELENSLDD